LVKQNLPEGAPAAILVLKPCCLGDVIMSTPVLAALRLAHPSARIDYAVGDWSAPALANNSRLNGRLDCAIGGSGRSVPFKDMMSLANAVRRGRYDWCLTLERSAVVGLVPWMAGVPVRAGLDSAGRGFAHTVRVPVARPRHEVETYLDVVRALGIPVTKARLEYFTTASGQHKAAGLLPDGDPWVAIHPGGGANPGMTLTAKRWPVARFAALARKIVEAGLRVALVGAEYDAPLASEIAAELANRPERWVNLAGALSLCDTAAVLERCAAFVGNDTGAMHLAVAVGTPPVALFGPTDPLMYGPYRLGEAVTGGLDCSPCFIDGRAARCEAPRCMEAIKVDRVWAGLQRALSGERVGS
jgi:lipopolysaccharide heptosyltransferase II